MLKRILVVGLFTGAGQLFSILVLKLVSQKANPGLLTSLAEMDSLYQFLLNAIALGLQPAAMRNIASSPEWQNEYHQTQSARLMISLLLLPVCLLGFRNPVYIIFSIAPLLALSGDYALYALGHPVKGAASACLRIALPFGCIIPALYMQPSFISYSYFAGLLLAYVFTDLYIARQLKMSFWVMPQWKNIFLYIKSIPLGLITLSLYFIGMGVLLVVPYFYPASIVAVAFVGLKLYLIFKGVLRIVHQSFMKDMLKQETCLQVDQLTMIGGLLFLGSVICFPASFITLFFGKSYIPYQSFFLLLGIGAMVYSFALSITTRALLEKRDKKYTIVVTTAAIVCVLLVIGFSFISTDANYIAISILAGELLFLAGMLIVLKWGKLLPQRISFFVSNAGFLLIPWALRYYRGDTTLLYISSFTVLAFLLVWMHRKKFLIIQ